MLSLCLIENVSAVRVVLLALEEGVLLDGRRIRHEFKELKSPDVLEFFGNVHGNLSVHAALRRIRSV